MIKTNAERLALALASVPGAMRGEVFFSAAGHECDASHGAHASLADMSAWMMQKMAMVDAGRGGDVTAVLCVGALTVWVDADMRADGDADDMQVTVRDDDADGAETVLLAWGAR